LYNYTRFSKVAITGARFDCKWYVSPSHQLAVPLHAKQKSFRSLPRYINRWKNLIGYVVSDPYLHPHLHLCGNPRPQFRFLQMQVLQHNRWLSMYLFSARTLGCFKCTMILTPNPQRTRELRFQTTPRRMRLIFVSLTLVGFPMRAGVNLHSILLDSKLSHSYLFATLMRV
jgi:hypothetical protein